MNIEAKLEKYRQKISETQDNDKKALYLKKIAFYESEKNPTAVTMEAGLLVPKIITGQKYELKFNPGQPTRAIAYGTIRKDYPLVLMEFDRKPLADTDILVEILYCGICHSDWHVIRNEWKNAKYPLIPGHEITGLVLATGRSVTKFKPGDYTALGPVYSTCQKCSQCQMGFEQYCLNDLTEIYNMPDRKPGEIKPTGPNTYGGYSNIIVANEKYAFQIPKGAPLDRMAPVLCAGATMYTPLKYFGTKTGTRVGIIGIGGLGHMGIKLAKSMGAYVVALTHTPEKLSDAKRLGADATLLISDTDKFVPFESSLDLIIDTIPFNHDINAFITLLKPHRTYWNIGSLFAMTVDFETINRKAINLKGSIIAGLTDSQEIINYCAAKNIYPETELIGIQDINTTHEPIVTSQVRYRYVIDMMSIYKNS